MIFCVVGAGFSGAVAARVLAEAGHRVTIIDEREHCAGDCHTRRDPATDIMLHVHGPHIFHTDNQEVWDYITSYCVMMPYINRVKAIAGGRVFSLPINLHTINQFFGTTFSPQEAREFIAAKARKDITNPQNFEEQALSMLGDDLYQAFFYGYTCKQWGVEPAALPASILKRLPVRFNYNDNYFNHRYQGIPRDGYTAIVAKICDHPNVACHLSTPFETFDTSGCDHVLYTGQIDRYFDFRHGRLGYRTLDFETFHADGDVQGTAVMNYCDRDVPHTRITEHKYFAPWEADTFPKTVCYREFSRQCGVADIPYYPIPLANERHLLAEYVGQASQQKGISFLGRMGTYRYLDMDVAIAEALHASREILARIKAGQDLPAFFIDPLA